MPSIMKKKISPCYRLASLGNSSTHANYNLYLSFSNYCKILKRRNTHKVILWSHSHTGGKTKDITKKENYRPIYLINTHAKIPNKIYTNQKQQYIKRIIPHDQFRFIPGSHKWFNICKSINVIPYFNKKSQKTHDYLKRYWKSIW